MGVQRSDGSWIDAGLSLLQTLKESQMPAITTAAQWCAEAIAEDGLVHLFGSGHSRIPVEEMFPRYGSFPGFNPITELSTTFHTQVVGANGQRQAMFIERVPGLAETILRNFDLPPTDVMIVFSAGGSTALPVEMAEGARARGLKTVAVTSVGEQGQLAESVDLVIDICTPVGDSLIEVDGSSSPVGPGSSLAFVAIANEIKVQVARHLAGIGRMPPVLTSAKLVGDQEKERLFNAAYDEFARRLATRLSGAGQPELQVKEMSIDPGRSQRPVQQFAASD